MTPAHHAFVPKTASSASYAAACSRSSRVLETVQEYGSVTVPRWLV
jgi:hypothetical protein